MLGEPEIGRTALLDAAAEAASAAAMQVLHAAGTEFEAEIAFAGLHQALLPLPEPSVESCKATGDVLDIRTRGEFCQARGVVADEAQVPLMDPSVSVVLVEELPGSGKTATSERSPPDIGNAGSAAFGYVRKLRIICTGAQPTGARLHEAPRTSSHGAQSRTASSNNHHSTASTCPTQTPKPQLGRALADSSDTVERPGSATPGPPAFRSRTSSIPAVCACVHRPRSNRGTPAPRR